MNGTISKGGQISVPAHVRRRWDTDRVRILDLGDRLIIEPVPPDPIAAARGSLRVIGGMTSERLRAIERDQRRAREKRR